MPLSNPRLFWVTCSALALAAALAPAATAQCTFREEQRLVAGDPGGGNHFGGALALDGDTLAVGCDHADHQGVYDTGAVYVFGRTADGWTEQAKLVPADSRRLGRFGTAVALTGDVLVGATIHDDARGDSAGSAWVFRFDGTQWVEEQRLVPEDPEESQWFGYAVALEGDVAVCTAYGDDQAGLGAGATYVFRHDGSAFVQEAKLLPSQVDGIAGMGKSVALDGDRIAVSTVSSPEHSGLVYVFRFDLGTWVEEAALRPAAGADEDRMGWRVALAGEVLAVTAPLYSGEAPLGGAAFVYRHNGDAWLFGHRLAASDPKDGDLLGNSVAIRGEEVLVGATGDDGEAKDEAGAVYAFASPRLSFDVNPEVAAAGDTVRLQSCAGLPATTVLLLVTDVNDAPVSRVLLLSNFDAQGHWETALTIPPGLAGLTLGMRTLGRTPRFTASNREALVLQ